MFIELFPDFSVLDIVIYELSTMKDKDLPLLHNTVSPIHFLPCPPDTIIKPQF